MIVPLNCAQAGSTNMQIKQNKAIVEGKVERVTPSKDGWGAEADIQVDKVLPSAGFDNFVQAKPGSVMKVFVPDPEGIAAGQTRRMSITVLGGPSGSRAVMQSSEKK
jgi:hypothetical protein